MDWPETERLLKRIRLERPELAAQVHASPGSKGHFFIRVSCSRKAGSQAIPGSSAILYGTGQWTHYKAEHPEPFCRPEESYHADALGREADHHGCPIPRDPPAASPITAGEMLARIVCLGRSDPDWHDKPGVVAELASAWGARIDRRELIADFEAEEIARLAPDCCASVLIARTGSGPFASGFAASRGEGATIMPPGIGSVPFDGPLDARRATFKDLIDTLGIGPRNQQKQLLLQAVKNRDRERGLFS